MAAELTVHINTYVTLAEANTYVEEQYLDSSTEAQAWVNASDTDKTKALIASATSLQNLSYKGRKKGTGQKLAFPRKYSVAMPGIVWLPYTPQSYDGSLIEGVGGTGDGWKAAQEAQILNAVAHLSIDGDLVADIRERTVSAVRSEGIGKASRSYDITSPRTKAVMTGIYDYDRVRYHLGYWLTDSVTSL